MDWLFAVIYGFVALVFITTFLYFVIKKKKKNNHVNIAQNLFDDKIRISNFYPNVETVQEIYTKMGVGKLIVHEDE